jgi:hypothetical protein
MPPCYFQRLVIARIGMTHDPGSRIGRQHALQASFGRIRASRYRHHSGMNRVADPDTAAVMDRHPARAARGIEECVQQRPIAIGALTRPRRTSQLNLAPASARSPYASQQMRAGNPWNFTR